MLIQIHDKDCLMNYKTLLIIQSVVQWNPLCRGHPDGRPTPLERPLVMVNLNMNVLNSTPDERPLLLWGYFSSVERGGLTRGVPLYFFFKFTRKEYQGSYRSLKCLKVLEIHHWFFKALKSLKNSTFLVKVLKSPWISFI